MPDDQAEGPENGGAGWAAADLRAGAARALQDALKVTAIMTPRAAFVSARRGDCVVERCADNTQGFDHLPVVEEGEREEIVGVLDMVRCCRRAAPDTRVEPVMEPLAEPHLIGAGASILAFLKTADERPFRLVVDGGRIEGLVSLSDIQQLPVRSALFALIMDLELAMADRISTAAGGFGDWLAHLDDRRREAVESAVAKARANNALVEEILFTTFADKRQIMIRMGLAPATISDFPSLSAGIKDLRNGIAHANSYARDAGAARKVCQLVGRIETLTEALRSTAGRPLP